MMSDFARSYSIGLKQVHDRRAKICEPCEFKSRDECPGWYWPDVSCPKRREGGFLMKQEALMLELRKLLDPVVEEAGYSPEDYTIVWKAS